MASLDMPKMELLDTVFPFGPMRPKPSPVDAGAVCVRAKARRPVAGAGVGDNNPARISSNGSCFAGRTTIFPRSITACEGTSARFWSLKAHTVSRTRIHRHRSHTSGQSHARRRGRSSRAPRPTAASASASRVRAATAAPPPRPRRLATRAGCGSCTACASSACARA